VSREPPWIKIGLVIDPRTLASNGLAGASGMNAVTKSNPEGGLAASAKVV